MIIEAKGYDNDNTYRTIEMDLLRTIRRQIGSIRREINCDLSEVRTPTATPCSS